MIVVENANQVMSGRVGDHRRLRCTGRSVDSVWHETTQQRRSGTFQSTHSEAFWRRSRPLDDLRFGAVHVKVVEDVSDAETSHSVAKALRVSHPSAAGVCCTLHQSLLLHDSYSITNLWKLSLTILDPGSSGSRLQASVPSELITFRDWRLATD